MSRSFPTLFGLALFAVVIACGRKTPQPSSGAGTTTASNVAASNGAVSTGLTLTTSDVAEARVVPLTDAVSISGHSAIGGSEDRKSTRLNSSHTVISYAVFCLKK